LWLDELPLIHHASGNPIGTLDLREKWEENRKEIQKNPFITIDKRSHPIQYASLLDLKLLILDHYELFNDVFPDLRQLDRLLDPLHNARTPASCYRHISEYAAEQLEALCRQLLDTLHTASSAEIAHQQSADEDEMVSVGATIEGKYKILDLAGWSDRSQIFKAWEILLERYVAIKVLLPDAQASPEQKKLQKDRLTREALIMAGLEDHPHIVSIYTALPQFPAIVMPWYEHTEHSLESMIRDENDIPLSWLLTLGLQLADALDHIHCKGITHRDLKPANILLNKKQEPVLIDFDIARASNVGTITRDEGGQPFYVGSARYSAPEQFMLGAEVGPYTDIFALGVVLYQAQTHQFPFPFGNNPANYRDSLLPTPERAEMPARLYEILCSALNQKPAQRPIAKTLREQLQEYLRTIEMI
jgi:serine/threonine protein kinase